MYPFIFTAIAKPVSAGSQPKMTLPQLHARNSFDATSAALIKAVESDAFKNKGEYEAVTEVKSVLHIYLCMNHLSKLSDPAPDYYK